MDSYYRQELAASRLRRCYELAPPRVRQYLAAEVAFVLERLADADLVLELGCGYGRVLDSVVRRVPRVIGIDRSMDSLVMARQTLGSAMQQGLLAMDAAALGFRAAKFDAVVCIQNGLAVFGVDPKAVVAEALRVTRLGGRILLSSYADRFWDHRLAWFEAQADAGLVGPIDHDATGNGVIACRDGFRAATLRPADFRVIAATRGAACTITEVDGSSVFCEITVT